MRFNYIICALLLCIASGCTDKVSGKAPGKSTDEDPSLKGNVAEERKIPVEAQYPSRKSISLYQKANDRIQAERRVDLIAKGSGQCMNVLVDEGDAVQKGDILAALDSAELEAQIRQSEVNVAQTKYQMEQAKRLESEGAGPLDIAENNSFAHEQAKASLDLLKVQLAQQTIRAPIGGVITRRDIQAGKLVTAGTPTFSITDPESLYLPVFVPEKELPWLAVGQKALITVDALAGKTFEATVRRINPSVDQQQRKSKVILDFKAEDRRLLVEGAYAEGRLVMETRNNALVVPKDAVREEYTRTYLMVVREVDGVPKAEMLEVETGLEDSEHMEIVSGIDDDTLVITLGHETLPDGTAVKVTTVHDEVELNASLSTKEALARAEEIAQNGFPKMRGGKRRH